MTPSEQNAAAGAWADTDPAGAQQAICSAGSLRALRHAYVALRREQPDARRRRVREAVRIVRLAVRALAGGGRLVSPDAFLFVNGINIAADAVVMVVGDGQSRTVFTGQLITTLAGVPVDADGLSALAVVWTARPKKANLKRRDPILPRITVGAVNAASCYLLQTFGQGCEHPRCRCSRKWRTMMLSCRFSGSARH